MAASVLLFTVYFLPTIFIQSRGLDLESLAQVERFVEKYGNHQQLFTKAKGLTETGTKLEKLNALAVISMLGTDEAHKIASAQGLVEDPRPEFRAYYLEYLLDYADEAHYNIAYIEALIEKEEDEECLYLLSRLLKLALMHQNDWNEQGNSSVNI